MDYAYLDISYSINQKVVTGLSVSYVIEAVEASTQSLGIAYAISDSSTVSTADEFDGTWGDNTQVAANMLPDWHAGRKGGAGSNYQQMLNSATMHMDDLSFEMIRGRRNMHLYTAETKDVYEVFTTFVEQTQKLHDSKNLLTNSDFSQKKPAIVDQPLYWSTSDTTGSISYAEDSLFGGRSIELRSDSGEKCRISQSVEMSDIPGQAVTLTAWIKIPVDSTVSDAEEADVTVANIQLSTLRMDGTPQSTQVALPVTTSGSWQRVSATVSSDSEIYSASCKLEVDATDASRTHLIYVGGLQLEVGEVSTSWQQGDNDTDDAPYSVVAFDEESVTAQETIGGVTTTWSQNDASRVYYIENEVEFLTTLVPTSISSIETTTDITESTAETVKGVYHEWTDKRAFSTAYEVDSNDSSVINRILRETGEVYQAFKLTERGIASSDTYVDASLYYDENGTYTQEVRTICLLGGNLLALVKDTYTPTDGSTTTAWSIKTINLDQHPGVDELQVVSDLKIPDFSGFTTVESTSGDFNYMGVASGNPKKLVLSTDGGTPAYIDITVAYDYYTADLNRGQLATRENYAGNLVIT